jgi:hypothetical protein
MSPGTRCHPHGIRRRTVDIARHYTESSLIDRHVVALICCAGASFGLATVNWLAALVATPPGIGVFDGPFEGFRTT